MKHHKDGRPFDDPDQIRSVFYAVRVLGVKGRDVLVDERDVSWLEKHLGWTHEKSIYWTASNGKQDRYLPETV